MIVFIVIFLISAITVAFARSPWSRRIGVWLGLLFWTLIAGILLYFLVRSCHSGWAWLIVILYFIINIGIIISAFIKVTKAVISKA